MVAGMWSQNAAEAVVQGYMGKEVRAVRSNTEVEEFALQGNCVLRRAIATVSSRCAAGPSAFRGPLFVLQSDFIVCIINMNVLILDHTYSSL